ncbi:hypothetical protein BLNAU_4337 [Blattamonas nauphoetae]|uniref:Uncharacterized protein n=1 Tax=Blattamonas nauphoetae TaxID=2049346 RepID=A0ABQ9Y2V2_9EUKA|nr:hypothetical protein BLNAU_21971 [Blattamonas nauphoetae]KAK2945009.1 hypothetical protein BLNAU_20086 [Blattamonas nauphoetae]KAK2958068.1 hypothetical protein BLNAU_6995 [Blattamonas nauphoetae]KAK2960682.1 hypothetical protein BLNAU_4337 [Blattamonas nauphoetae]
MADSSNPLIGDTTIKPMETVLFEICPEHQKVRLLTPLMSCAVFLASDAFGNCVVQRMFDSLLSFTHTRIIHASIQPAEPRVEHTDADGEELALVLARNDEQAAAGGTDLRQICELCVQAND